MADKPEAIFVSGLYLNRVNDKAPAFIITNQDIHVDKLINWLTLNRHLANEKGYIRIQGKVSQTKDDKGFNKRYFQVDTYKPTSTTETPQTSNPSVTERSTQAVDPSYNPEYPMEDINPENIPF